MLCPNYQLAPFINGAAPTINMFVLIVGVPVYNGAAPTINISLHQLSTFLKDL